MTSSISNSLQQSREEFARHLRERAREAAAASVQQAALSQQYLDLSKKFAELAEQAEQSNLDQLQETFSLLESQLHSGTELAVERTVSADDSQRPSGLPVQLSKSVPAVPGRIDSPSDAEQSVSERVRRGRKSTRSRFSARSFVQRVRSVQLAATKRIRIRARRSDLKPKQRTVKEEVRKGSSSLVVSLVALATVIVALSLTDFQIDPSTPLNPIIASFAAEPTPVEEAQPVEPPEEEVGEQQDEKVEEPVKEEEESEPEEPPEQVEAETAEMQETEPTESESSESAPEMPADENAMADASSESIDVSSIDNRSSSGRKVMLQKYGGSQASESAVHLALEWLASVQRPDGSWDFTDIGANPNPGTVLNPIGGTAYALLPFLAAGQTHREGDYQKQVEAGLTYLTNVGVSVPAGYDLRGVLNKGDKDSEPNEAYYVHGAATLVLCEALFMTNDRRLRRPAEGAVKFLVNSQDPNGGGWRYLPQEPGSTSVTAIQLMALMAAKKTGIRVPESSLKGVSFYLDSVQVDGEGRYGYEIERKTYKGSITAMALLCRMYLGWGRDDGDLRAGIGLLDKAGPYNNLYTNYFATQVMRNWGGEEWNRWNERLRDDLVRLQETDGPTKGSWTPRDRADYSVSGGRLLTTSLAALTLEVYYRYKPLLPEE